MTLTGNVVVGPSIHVLTFALPPDDPMEFVPGQYVTFYLRRDGKSVTRSYSIYSSASLRDRFALLVKRVPMGFASNHLCDLSPSPATTETILAPLGKFLYRDPGDRRVLMVATGVGLAPFVPMLERLRERSPSTDTWLVWGNRHAEDMVGRSALEDLAAAWPRFHFAPVLSRPPSDGSWRGATGHVQDVVRSRFPDLADVDVYLCGANAMVNEMQDLAISLGAPKDHVYVDRWGEHSQ
ncbi:MAG: FAD-dependent oxidoreductase [Thermoplasmata archaeon]